MARKQKQHQERLKHRLQEKGSELRSRLKSRAEVAAELAQPERFAHYLGLFSHLAVLHPSLHACILPIDPLVGAILSADLPDEVVGSARGEALRAVIVPLFASAEFVGRCQDAIQAALQEAQENEMLLALTAAGALSTSCQEESLRPDHPFWKIIYEISLAEALLSGRFLIGLVHHRFAIDDGAVARTFAKVLAGGPLARELDALGLVDPAPTRLAQAYARIVAGPPFSLRLDSILHLLQAHVELAGSLSPQLTTSGPTAALFDDAHAAYEVAFAADLTSELVDEGAAVLRQRLESLRDDPEQVEGLSPEGVEAERERCLAAYLGLRALPIEVNALLRAIHVRSLEGCRALATELEVGFIRRIWGDPTDRFALEEYQSFLREQGERARAHRVGRYLEGLAGAKAAKAAKAEGKDE